MRHLLELDLDDGRLRASHLITGRDPRSGEPVARLDPAWIEGYVRDVLAREGKLGVLRCERRGVAEERVAPVTLRPDTPSGQEPDPA